MPTKRPPGPRDGVGRRFRRSGPVSHWDTEVDSAYAIFGFLLVGFAGFTVLVMGPLVGLDAALNVNDPPDSLLPMLHVLDRMGSRIVACPVLALVALWIHRRTGYRRVWAVAVVATLGMIFGVGVLKLSFARSKPSTLDPGFFSDGMAYPSGHTSNVVLIFGLIPYLLATYAAVRPWVVGACVGIVGFLMLWMVTVSVTLSWHWFSDLWAGLMSGGMALALTVAVDHSLPPDLFRDGWWAGIRRIPGLIWRRVPVDPVPFEFRERLRTRQRAAAG